MPVKRLLGRGATPASVLDTLPGRLFLLSSSLLLVIIGAQFLVELPLFLVIFRRVVSIASILSGLWLAVVIIRRSWARFMWRVRRKLILSYLFFGLVPVFLISVFSVVAALVMYIN